MAKKVELEVNIKGNAGKAINQLEKDLTDLNATFEDVYGEIQPLTGRMGELEDRLYELALAGKQNTQEYKDLLKQVGLFKKTIQDTDIAVDATATTLSGKLSGSLNGALAGFQAYESTLGLIGVESEQLQETLLKVQSAIGLSQGIQQLQKEGIPAFKALGSTAINAFKGMSNASKVFLATGIGLLITGIATAIAYADDLKEMFGQTMTAQDALRQTNEDYKKSIQDTTLKVTQVGNAFDLAKKGVISKEEALKTYNDTLGDSLGKANSYNEAEKLFVSKSDAFIKATALRAQATALLGKAAEEQANALTASLEDQTTLLDKASAVSITGELNVKKFAKIQKQRVAEEQAESKKRAKIFEDEAKKLLTQAESIDKSFNLESKADTQRTENAKQNTDTRKQDLEKLREFEQGVLDARLSEYDQEILAVQRKYDEQLKIAKKYGQDTKTLEQGLADELSAIRKKQIEAETSDLAVLRKEEQSKTIEDEKSTNDAIISLVQELNKKKQEQREADNAREKENNQLKKELAFSGLALISEIADLFGSMDEKRAKKAFQVQKAVSLAETGIKAVEGVQSAFTTASKSPLAIAYPAYPFIQAGIAGAFGIFQLNKIARSQYGGSVDTSASGGAGGGGGTGTGANASTPNFNIIGQAGNNQLNQLQPQQVYVVGSQVTTQQQLDRERIKHATFG